MVADPYQNTTVGPEKFSNVGYKLPKIRSQSIRNKEVVMNYDFEKNPSHQVDLDKYFGQGRASVDNRPQPHEGADHGVRRFNESAQVY